MSFTIKVRDSAGNDTLYSAEKIEVVPPREVGTSDVAPAHSNWDEAGIFLDRDPAPLAANEMRYSKEIILFGGEYSEAAKLRKGGTAWVMNEQGATVATYDL